MTIRGLREHVADFYGDKSLSTEAVDRLVSLAVADGAKPTGGAALRFPGRWLYSVVGVAAGIAMTLLAAPWFSTQDIAARDSIVESDLTGRPTLVNNPFVSSGCKGCDRVAATGEGFCCGKGRDFGVPHSSKKLHAALVGHKIDAATTEEHSCKTCLKKLKSGGLCHHLGLVVGKTYVSPVSYILASGTLTSGDVVASASANCELCKTAFKKNGRCETCGVGFVAGRSFDEVEAYTAALAALRTLTKATRTVSTCEGCAVAMVVDGTCAHCKVSYKNGNLIAHGG